MRLLAGGRSLSWMPLRSMHDLPSDEYGPMQGDACTRSSPRRAGRDEVLISLLGPYAESVMAVSEQRLGLNCLYGPLFSGWLKASFADTLAEYV